MSLQFKARFLTEGVTTKVSLLTHAIPSPPLTERFLGYDLTTNHSNSSCGNYTTSKQFTTGRIWRQMNERWGIFAARARHLLLQAATKVHIVGSRVIPRSNARIQLAPGAGVTFLDESFHSKFHELLVKPGLITWKNIYRKTLQLPELLKTKEASIFRKKTRLEFSGQDVEICNMLSHVVRPLLYRNISRV